MAKRVLIFCIFVFLISSNSYTQGYEGKDFWIGSATNGACWRGAFGTVELHLYSKYNARITISINSETYIESGIAQPYKTVFKLTAGKRHIFQVPEGVSVGIFYSDEVTNNGIHVESDSLVQLYYLLKGHTQGALAVLPSESIPIAPDYIISTNLNNVTGGNCMTNLPILQSSQFVIVGISDKSRIEILPTGSSVSRTNKIGIPFVISLNKGETFLYNSMNYDLSGTLLRSRTSESKFAVFAGNSSSVTGLKDKNNFVCASDTDHSCEQMLPVTTWGKSYSLLPFKRNKGGYFVKVLSLNDSNQIFINGIYHSTINTGKYISFNLHVDSATKIESTFPISVTQFMKGPNCSLHPNVFFKVGGLSQMQIVSDEQIATETHVYQLLSPVDYIDSVVQPEFYVNILCKIIDSSLLTINGNKINKFDWKYDPNLPEYVYCQLTMSSIQYEIKNPKGFIAYTYEYFNVWKHNEGYASIAGASAFAINENFTYDNQCKGERVRFSALNPDNLSKVEWDLGLNEARLQGKSVDKFYKDTGWYRITMYYEKNNLKDSSTKKLYINVGNRKPFLIEDTLVCGVLNMAVYAKYFNTDNKYLWNTGHVNYYHQIQKSGVYWAVVEERNGCSFRDTVVIGNQPKPHAWFEMSDSVMCSNKISEVLFVNKSYSNDSVQQFRWDFDDFNPVDTMGDSIYHTFNKVGQHLITLKATTDFGCDDDTTAVFEVLKAPEARFEILIKDSCLGSNKVSFKNTTIKDTDLHKWYKWYFSEGFVISNNNPNKPRVYADTGLYKAYLIYENSNGCMDTAKKDIQIYPQPIANFHLKSNISCDGDSVNFVNTSQSKYTPIKSYWEFGDSFKDTIFNPKHLYPSKGYYTVRLKSVSKQSCVDSIEKSIYISGSATADFSIDDSIQCLSSNVFTIVNQSSSDTGTITNTNWTFSDASTSSKSDSIHKTFYNYGSHFIQLRVTNSFGCEDSILKNILVERSPQGSIAVNQSSQCEVEQDFDFTFKKKNTSDSIYAYKWMYSNDSSIGSSNLNNIRFNSNGLQTIQIQITDSSGCVAILSKDININPSPNLKFSVSDTSQCFHLHRIEFENTSSISSGKIESYFWTFGDQTSSTLKLPPVKSYSKGGRYAIALQATSDSNCSQTDTLSILIEEKADIQIKAIPSVCLNDSSIFTSSAKVNGGSILNYKWELGDGATSSFANTKHVYDKVGTYPVRLITETNSNCIDTTEAPNKALVLNLPEAVFNHFILDEGNNTLATFINTSKQVAKTQWDFGSFGSSNKIDTTLLIKDSITLKVAMTVTDYNGCSNTKESYIFISVPLKIFIPNAFSPNGDAHNDGFGPEGIDFASDYQFIIYNRWGEIVFKTNTLGEKWDGNYKGKACKNEVYIYTIELHDFFGRYKTEKGSVLLLR